MGNKNIYERFLWFDGKARAKRYPNASRLAREFETSLKTAQRDIEFMRDRLGCPLQYDSSRKGYYYEDETFSLPSIYVSSEVLSALIVTKQILKGISAGPLGSELSLLIEKISSILKRHVTDGEIIDEAVSVRHIAYTPPPEEIFGSVLAACLKRRSLSFSYYSPASNEKTTRKVDPYHLFNYMGTWHLVGYCHLRHGLRDFNISRISDLRMNDETFTIRDCFTVGEYFGSAFGLYKSSDRRVVTLRFRPEKARRVRGQIWHEEQAERSLPDGSLELSFPVADFSEIAMEILKHGPGVEVLAPEELRSLIREKAAGVLSIYR